MNNNLTERGGRRDTRGYAWGRFRESAPHTPRKALKLSWGFFEAAPTERQHKKKSARLCIAAPTETTD